MSFTSGAPSWRTRDVLVSGPARAVSELGNALAVVALVLRMHDDGGGARWVAAVLLADALPIALLSPLAGVLVDRFDNRRIIVVASLLQAGVCTALAFSSSTPVVLALVALLGACTALTGPAWGALVRRMVVPEALAGVFGLQQTLSGLALVAGPALGGLLMGAYGPRVPLLVDAATFLAVTGAALAIRVRRRPAAERAARGAAASSPRMRDGFVLIWQDRPLAAVLAMLCAFILVGQVVNVAEVFLVRDVLGGSATAFGLVSAAWAVGLLAGGVLGGTRSTAVQQLRAVLGSALVLAAVSGLAGAAPSVPALIGLFLLGGVANGVLGVCVLAWTMLRVDDAVIGRVGAALNGLTRTAGIAALAVGGAAVGLLEPRQVFGLAGAAGIAVVLGFLPVLSPGASLSAPRRGSETVLDGDEGSLVARARTEGPLHAEGVT